MSAVTNKSRKHVKLECLTFGMWIKFDDDYCNMRFNVTEKRGFTFYSILFYWDINVLRVVNCNFSFKTYHFTNVLNFFLNKYEFLKLNKDFRHTLNDIFMQSK